MSPRAARPFLTRFTTIAVAAIGAVAFAGTALARSSDRNQPMDIDAATQECTLDESGQCVFTGAVVITQGTLNIQSARAVIHRSGGDPSRAVLTGKPAVLKQQMDDGTQMTARASSIDYNINTEVVVLSGNVSIDQPRGSMTGQRVVYNLKTGQVNSGGEGNGRVKMRIQPKASQGAAAQGKG